MKRSLGLLALLVALPAFAESLTIHLDLSDSVRRAIAGGQINAVGIQAAGKFVKTTDAAVTVDGVAPGKYTLRALLLTDRIQYVVDPKGVVVEVAPGAHAEATLPIHSLWISGTVCLHGKSFKGQLSLWPSVKNRENWGFAVPLDDEGRFAFPLPHAGDWDLRVWAGRNKELSPIPNFAFHEGDTERQVHIDASE